MELTKKQVEFWAVMLFVCLAASVVVMLVDFSIKTSILEESNSLRRFIEHERSAKSPPSGASNIPPLPGNILSDDNATMAEGTSPNGDTAPSTKPQGGRRTKPSSPSRNREIPSTD